MIKELAKNFNYDEIKQIKASDLVLDEALILRCMYGCDSYRKNWACPPHSPTVDAFRKILGNYKKALIVIKKVASQKDQEKFTISLTKFENDLFLKGYYKAFALAPGPCPRCKPCKYPEECANPKDKRPNLEGLGVNLFATLKKLGIEMEVLTDKEKGFDSYGIILLE